MTKSISIHLKILAYFYLFAGYGLLLMVLLGQLAFLKYWWGGQQSVLSDTGSFFKEYTEYFDSFGVSPLWSAGIAVVNLLFGHGLLRFKVWALHLGFLISVSSLLAFIWNITQGIFDRTILFESSLAILTLVILFMNKTALTSHTGEQ